MNHFQLKLFESSSVVLHYIMAVLTIALKLPGWFIGDGNSGLKRIIFIDCLVNA
jgi:hypothetical protein